jgi:hypothetical protein
MSEYDWDELYYRQCLTVFRQDAMSWLVQRFVRTVTSDYSREYIKAIRIVVRERVDEIPLPLPDDIALLLMEVT